MGIVVQKYGGSSVATVEKITNIAKRVIERKEAGDSMIVVVSAMGKTTDGLISLAKSISDKPNKRELDALIATGEMVSSSLLSMAINNMGHDAISLNAYQISIQTDGTYGKSLIQNIEDRVLNKYIDQGKIIIVAGFQGISDDNEITTLGRGGSDTTAVAIAAKMEGVCEIYTDVDGIYTVDPRIFSDAKKLDEISYEEMVELSSLGAKVMHSRSVELAQKYNIPIYVGESCSDKKGTYIREVNKMENKPITGIAVSDADVSITLEDINYDINMLSDIFESIANKKINIDMISQTAPSNGKVSLSFTIPEDEIDECINILGGFAEEKNITVDRDITKFSVVGIGMKTTSGVASKIFRLFKENNIQVKMITTSEIKITCAIKREDKGEAVNVIAREFNL
ncbi:aspartate kinase [Peptoclostridium litorale DSM 5388]|uniref:Aspartokinase n=1 Tax=Peptoclostridium litorale DSM 5388 TaxID=1121324 RepID=A0A069RBD2_PEPLI|nr:aspartate kinase [Peptoclostridium litorale]KDR94083.1 aspartokinase 2 [Peptoclostridium litorale DSM 5388]SIN80637.1 aspartate kinase [Peptoclostridium litorale DSM 5388]